ncbi:ABC transporter permease [Marispirochaeta aestuarii]|uniref:ABC transporter permease n=1 Tax=Marispirochaeta aestuarii TaxID=1963862 RepID=UPI0029C64BF0|nr:ABC transporter permease [Marispirochaeta aestuarii]
MRIILALIKKEFRQLVADPFFFRFLLFAPLAQLVVLGFSLTLETTNVSLVVCDLDCSPSSRELITALGNSEHFVLTGQVLQYQELEQSLRRWEAAVGIYIPPDFSRRSNIEGSGKILVLLDSVDGNKALTAFGYLQQIVSAESVSASPVQITYRYRFNPELRSEVFMVPGIVVVIITIITLLIASMSLVREKERGTLEQLSVTPITKGQLIAGKLLPFLFYAFVELAIILRVAEAVFRLSPAGSILQLYFAVLIYLASTLGLGLLISSIASTQQQALFIAWFCMVFMILLSGFFIPIDNMPLWLQRITLLNPLRFMMTIVREIYLKSTPLNLLLDQLLPLAALGVAIFGASLVTFKKTVK